MQFKVITKAKSVWTPRKRAILRDALEYANCYLGLYTCSNKVIIRLTGDAHSPGLCCDLENRLLVKLSGVQSEEEIVETLFHELTHVRQYALGHLEDVGEQVVFWLGHEYKGDFEDTSTETYWNAPWEVEAREVAWDLVEDYYQN